MGEAARKQQSKEEAFKENPDRFLDLGELILGLTAKGLLVNPEAKRGLLISAMYDLKKQFDYYVAHMDRESAKSKTSGIVIPGGNGKNRLNET